MRYLKILSNDRTPVLCKRGSERGKLGESPVLTRRDLLSLGPLPPGRAGMVRGGLQEGPELTSCFPAGRVGLLAFTDVFCFPSALTAGSSPCPHSAELAHDQFQNETFVCQTCTAVAGLPLVCCGACRLLAAEKKTGEELAEDKVQARI